ncbi:MAG: U32 family peptidase [Clostridia bacterium]|nr:U32 family peptidase [Clostridia bacterium]
MSKRVELLSPVGSMEALYAAVSAGADAVYLGAASFGARSQAAFSEDALERAIRFAHLYGRRVHVTVNTLCKEKELSEVRQTLAQLSRLKADAVLIQDLGVLSLCRREFPELCVHASTQMTIHQKSGVEWLKSLGVRRAVLARECSLDDIRNASSCGLETEVFAHGALCVCVSGQCLFSSGIGERSGNRGRCAQPCRLTYRYRGAEGAWLSPADLCGLNNLPQLLVAGVDSLKLEGRLKRPEYVYTVTDVYRRAIDACLAGRPWELEQVLKETAALEQIFSRGSFTEGYAAGCQDRGILYPERAKPVGVPIGQALSYQKVGALFLTEVALTKDLNNGDGLEIGEQKCVYSGPDRPAGQRATLRLHQRPTLRETVRRSDSEAQLRTARAHSTPACIWERFPIDLTAQLFASPGLPLQLTLQRGDTRMTVQGAVAQPAAKRPLDQATAWRSLSKTGDTPFRLTSLVLTGDAAFASAAELNALRREGLTRMEELLSGSAPDPAPPCPLQLTRPPVQAAAHDRLIVRTSNLDEADRLKRAGADLIVYRPRELSLAALSDFLKNPPDETALCLPTVCPDELLKQLRQLNTNAVPIMLGSPGQLGAGFQGSLMADYGIPVYNHETELLLAEQGLSAAMLSPELSFQDVLALPEPTVERILPVYGRVRYMLLTHCPERTFRGLTSGKEACRLCAGNEGVQGRRLTDRMGAEYPLLPLHFEGGCQVELYGAAPISLLAYIRRLRDRRLSYLLDFTDETPERRVRLVQAFSAALRGEEMSIHDDGFVYSVGRFADGVL